MDEIGIMQMRRHENVLCIECYSNNIIFDDEKNDYRCGDCGSYV